MGTLNKEQIHSIVAQAIDRGYKHIRVNIEADGRTTIRIDGEVETKDGTLGATEGCDVGDNQASQIR